MMVTSYVRKYAREVIAVLAVIVLMAIAWAGYSFRKSRSLEQSALIYAERVRMIEEALHSKSPELRNVADDSVRIVRTRCGGTAYEGLMYAQAARIYELDGQYRAAAGLFDEASKAFARFDSGLGHMYAISAATMRLNSNDEAERSQARSALEKLAQERDNPYRSMASFYLGYDAYLNNDTQKADAYWGSLFDMAHQPLNVWGLRVQQIRDFMA